MNVSIITAVFNQRNYIESCLESLASQTYPHIEHIIIDGGSTDGTLEVIKEVVSQQRRVKRVVSQTSPITNHQLPITGLAFRESSVNPTKVSMTRSIKV